MARLLLSRPQAGIPCFRWKRGRVVCVSAITILIKATENTYLISIFVIDGLVSVFAERRNSTQVDGLGQYCYSTKRA